MPEAQAYLQVPEGLAAKSYRSTKRLLKLLTRAIYISMLLVIVKAALWAAGSLFGDWITIGYVVLLIVFFSALALFLFLFALTHRASAEPPPPSLDLQGTTPDRALRAVGLSHASRSGAAEVAKLCERGEADSSRPLRVRGRVRPWGSREPEVLQEMWATAESDALRLVQACAMLLELEKGAPPVVVQVLAPPVIVSGNRQRGDGTALLLGTDHTLIARLTSWVREASGGALSLDSLSQASTLILRAGAEVEVAGWGFEVAPDLDELVVSGRRSRGALASGPSPYRGAGGQRALLLTSSPDRPMVIRDLGRARRP
jgi:hypothetical protein